MSVVEDRAATLERPTTSGWRTAPTPSPEAAARNGANIVQLGGVWWMIGGCPQEQSDLSSPDCLVWTRVDTASPRRPGNAGAAFGPMLMLTGGMGQPPRPPPPRPALPTNEVYLRTPPGPWTLVQPAPWRARREHMMANFDGKTWVIGGADGSYSWFADAWYVAGDLPEWQNDATWSGPARGDAAVAVYGDQLWVIGGKTNDPIVGWLADAAVKSAGRPRSVQTIAADFAPRYGAQAQVVGDKLYVFGGAGSYGGLNDMWCYDGQAWTRLPDTCPWSMSLGGFCSTVKDGEIYVLSGYDTSGAGGNATIYIYSPPA